MRFGTASARIACLSPIDAELSITKRRSTLSTACCENGRGEVDLRRRRLLADRTRETARRCATVARGDDRARRANAETILRLHRSTILTGRCRRRNLSCSRERVWDAGQTTGTYFVAEVGWRRRSRRFVRGTTCRTGRCTAGVQRAQLATSRLDALDRRSRAPAGLAFPS